MKAILALGAAAALSGCAYYDPYVYDTPYYGTAPGYYGTAPGYYGTAPGYYGSAPYLITPQPYNYGYGFSYYDYPNVYPAQPWVAPAPRLRPRPHGPRTDAHTAKPDDGESGRRPSRPGRGGGDRGRGESAGGGGESGWTPGGGGADAGATGGGGSGYVPNQPPDK
jgi:hypothetical protein